MTSPAVSILMSVRNEERYLEAALNSIARQTLADWELVVVDDGSTDATPDILASFARSDARVRVVRQAAYGLVAALNKGLACCRSPLVARMDGDDVCHPRRLQEQVTFLRRHPDIALVASRVRHFPSPRVRGGMRHYEEWQNGLIRHDEILRDLFVESPFAQPSVLFRKDVVVDLGGYREQGWAEDYDLWLRMAEAGCRFGRVPQTLLFWREHADRLTHTGDHCTLAAFRRCKAHYLKRGYLKNNDGVTLWGAGMEGKAWRKALQEIGLAVARWIEVDPGKIGQTIHRAPVLSPDDLAPGCGPMLVTIGARGARRQVRQKCSALGLCEGVDFLCVT